MQEFLFLKKMPSLISLILNLKCEKSNCTLYFISTKGKDVSSLSPKTYMYALYFSFPCISTIMTLTFLFNYFCTCIFFLTTIINAIIL